MPRAFPNAYAYQSPIGQGLQNIAQMLLADDGGARAAVMAAQGQAAQAQAAKYRADAEQTAYQTEGAKNFLHNSARNLVGNDAATQALRYLQGVTEYVPAREDPERQMTMAPTMAPVQRPANLDADKEQQLRRLMGIAASAQPNGQFNMENTAKALAEVAKTGAFDGVMQGKVDPSLYTIASGKPLYHFGETYAGNVVTGDQKQNELGKAKVGTERAHQGAYGAQANAANANARQSDRTNVLVKITNPLDPNTTILVPASEVYRQTEADKRNKDTIAGRKDVAELRNPDGTPMKIIKTTQDDRNALGNALSAWIVKDTGYPIADDDPEKPKLLEESVAFYSTPGSPGYLNPQAATRLAIDKLSATGKKEGGWFSENKTKLSIVPPSQRVENQGAAAPAQQTAGPAVGEVRKGYRFKGGDPGSKAAWEKI